MANPYLEEERNPYLVDDEESTVGKVASAAIAFPRKVYEKTILPAAENLTSQAVGATAAMASIPVAARNYLTTLFESGSPEKAYVSAKKGVKEVNELASAYKPSTELGRESSKYSGEAVNALLAPVGKVTRWTAEHQARSVGVPESFIPAVGDVGETVGEFGAFGGLMKGGGWVKNLVREAAVSKGIIPKTTAAPTVADLNKEGQMWYRAENVLPSLGDESKPAQPQQTTTGERPWYEAPEKQTPISQADVSAEALAKLKAERKATTSVKDIPEYLGNPYLEEEEVSAPEVAKQPEGSIIEEVPEKVEAAPDYAKQAEEASTKYGTQVKFDGMWKGFKEGERPSFSADINGTKTSFVLQPGETIENALDRKFEQEKNAFYKAVKIGDKVHVGKPTANNHGIVWDEIPDMEKARADMSKVESGWAKSDGSEFTVDMSKVELGKEAESRAKLAGEPVETPTAQPKKWYEKVTNEAGAVANEQKKPFYSKLEEIVSMKMSGKMDVEQLKKMLKNSGVSDAEVNTVLGDLKGSVTKKEVLDALVDNGTKFEDVVLGDKSPSKIDSAELIRILKDNDNLGYDTATEALRDLRTGELSIASVEWNKPEDKAKFQEFIAERQRNINADNKTYYEQYSEPGYVPGSYRELFVTAPDVKISLDEIKDPFNLGISDFDSPKSQVTKNWQDGHPAYSSIQNPIVRIRYNERDVNGKRILFVEEFQGPSKENQSKMPEALQKRIYDIGVKRVLALAKEQGFDGVAWTTGEMQASRYDLSKHLDRIDWHKTPTSLNPTTSNKRFVDIHATNGGSIMLYVDDEGIITNSPNTTQGGKRLEEIIGKELTKQIMEQGRGKLDGLDLKVGGEGLKYLYDKQIPSLMKKYGKEEVKETTLTGTEDIDLAGEPTKNSTTKVPYTPITSKTPGSFTLYSDPFGLGATLSRLSQGNRQITELVSDLKKSKQIVDTYDPVKMGDKLPDRQETGIPLSKPKLARLKDISLEVARKVSPSFTWRKVFNLQDNAGIDAQKAHMTAITNVGNSVRYINEALKDIPNNYEKILAEVKPLFDKNKSLLDDFEVIENEKSTLLRTLRKTTPSTEGYLELDKRIKELTQAEKDFKKRPQFAELEKAHNELLKTLAEKYPDTRVYLAAEDSLPEGIKLSPVEQKAADQLRKYQESTRDKLETLGIPVIKTKGYMTHLWQQLVNDKTAMGIVDRFQAKPTLLSFMSRLPDSQTWLPSAHEAMKGYVPIAEYKIAYQPFLSRWRPFIDSLQQPQLQKFMNDWISDNMNKKDIGGWDKLVNAAVGVEYARTIGLSLSVGMKHLMKLLGTPAEYGISKTLEAAPQVAIVPFQSALEFGRINFSGFRKAAENLGVTEKTTQLELFRHYVIQSDLVKMMTEIPIVEGMDTSVFGSGRMKQASETTKVAIRTIGKILSQPVRTVEAFDNGVSIMAGAIAGKVKGIDPLVIERKIWEGIVDVNLRAGWDQPLAQKTPGIRAITMFQMTPLKLQERLYKWVHDAVVVNKDPETGEMTIGKRDAFGTHGGAKLARFLLMVGAAEVIARENDTSILGMAMAHLPFIGEPFEATKEGIGFKLKEPTPAASPLVQWVSQVNKNGVWGGTKEHLKGGFVGVNFLSKVHKAGTKEYPTKYESATKYMLGLPKLEGKNDLETVMKEQKEEKKDQAENLDELSAKFAREKEPEAKKELIRKVLKYIKTQPEEEQDRLANRFTRVAEMHTTHEHKWWQGLSTLTPENKAKVFFDKYKDADKETKLQMLKDAELIGGFTSERFNAALDKEVEKYKVTPKSKKFSIKSAIHSIIEPSGNPS
jgi:hypothetical protein